MNYSSIFNRIYSDYLMPCRLPKLRLIYEKAKSNRYEFHSLISFYDKINSGSGIDARKKYFISRCDVDTDVSTARMIFDLYESLCVRSSFYFRLSTIDKNLMKKIEKSGSEASYHFEEIATLAKLHRWKSRSEIDFNLARELFVQNFSHIKNESGLAMRSVCSHGDFVNRSLGVVNHELLNTNVRNILEIELEAYDEILMSHVHTRHSDKQYPEFYSPSSPLDSIEKGVNVIYFLLHPRHWRASPFINTKDNFVRIYEGIHYGRN